MTIESMLSKRPVLRFILPSLPNDGSIVAVFFLFSPILFSIFHAIWPIFLALIFSVVFFVGVDSHGLMQKPPSRSTVWRHIDEPLIAPFVSLITDDAKNWNDNELFCGGAQVSLGPSLRAKFVCFIFE